MMTDEHLLHLLPDYALGLLPAEERRRVERHAGQCAACRAALGRERALSTAMRGAIQTAAAPPPGRLAALRPRPATRARPAPLYARLAPLTMVMALLALGLLFGRGAPPFAPAVFAGNTPTLTATSTQTPTATTSTGATTATQAATATEIADRPAQPAAPPATPAPPPPGP